MDHLVSIASDAEQLMRELVTLGSIQPGQLIVIGTSTSEVAGQRIGTHGTEAVAAQIFKGLETVRQEYGFHLAFQCCEHLNRALVLERSVADQYRLDEVMAVPVPKAGGAMAAYAYRQLQQPCLVETIEAHAGIDIGETLIGMHLRRVAVPVRPTLRHLGEARVTMAVTRPKLIGGARAVYTCD